jgi:hypothetical protein
VLLPAPGTLTTGPVAELINQDPEDGRLLNTTEPVAVVQLGCMIVPTVGIASAPAAALICTDAEGAEVHPALLVTVNV